MVCNFLMENHTSNLSFMTITVLWENGTPVIEKKCFVFDGEATYVIMCVWEKKIINNRNEFRAGTTKIRMNNEEKTLLFFFWIYQFCNFIINVQ